MKYEFYYNETKGVEHISYTCFNDETSKGKYGKIGDTDKLIDFINRHYFEFLEVYFVEFKEEKVSFILKNISSEIEVYYPTIGYEGPFQMLKKLKKVRGK